MRSKGLAAILDGLLAYSIAFIAIGFIVLLMTDTPNADIKTTYTLNVWAEDIADAVGMSLVQWNNTSRAWFDSSNHTIALDNLNTSLHNLAAAKGISILVLVDGAYLFNDDDSLALGEVGNMTNCRETATAKRFLVKLRNYETPDYNRFSALTVQVGLNR